MSFYSNDMRIALNFIFRNNREIIDNMLDSVLPYVDRAYAVDTGSEDGTRERCKERGVIVIDGMDLIDPEDGILTSFADARNRALDATEEPYMIWLDTDDVLVNGEMIPNLMALDLALSMAGVVYARYNYQRDPMDRLIAIQDRERILQVKAGRWGNPVHETFHFDFECQSMTIEPEKLCVEHRHKVFDTGALERNVVILKKWLQTCEPEREWFVRHYLGTTLSALEKPRESIENLQFAIDNTDDTFVVFDSLMTMASILLRQEDWYQAKKALTRALEFIGSDPRPYLGLAKCAIAEGRYEDALFFGKVARSSEYKFAHQTHNPLEKDVFSLYVQAEALYETGRYEEAGACIKTIEEESGVEKDATEIHDEIRRYEVIALQTQAAHAQFVADLDNEPFKAFIKARYQDSPAENRSGWGRMREISEEIDDRTVDILCGITAHPFTGEHVGECQVGGSEHQLILMAEGLAARGWRVRVYNGRKDGTIESVNGVEYRPFEMAASRDERNIVVCWRGEWLLDFPVQAKTVVAWFQDTTTAYKWPPWRKERVDAIVTLTEWHAELLREETGLNDKVHIIGNVVPDHVLDNDIEREPHSVIWTSAPYRGLDIALKLWPKVVAKVPDAKLRIAGGFGDLYDRLTANCPLWTFEHLGVKPLSWFKHYCETLTSELHNMGVEYLGPLPPKEVCNELLRHAVWLYTCVFNETFCIAAAEAEKYGAVPICPPKAALAEVASHRIEIPLEPWKHEDHIADTIVQALLNQDDLESRRAQAVLDDGRFSVDRMLDKWEEIFHTVRKEVVPVLETPREVEDFEIEIDCTQEEYIKDPGKSRTMNALWNIFHDRKGKSLLSLGSGHGSEVLGAIRTGYERIVGIDRWEKRMARAKEVVGDTNGQVEWLLQDIEEDWNIEGTFDIVTIVEVLEHVHDPTTLIQRAKEHLAPNGLLLVTVPAWAGKNGANSNCLYHRRIYSRRGLIEALGPGAEVTCNSLSLIGKWENKDVVS